MTIEAKIDALCDEIAAMRTAMKDSADAPVLAVTKKEAARMCGVSYDTLRPLFDDGTIRTVPYGTTQRVPVSELVKYTEQQLERAGG